MIINNSFSACCFSIHGIDLLNITLANKKIPKYLFTLDNDNAENKEYFRSICKTNNIKHIEMKSNSNFFDYLKDNINLPTSEHLIILMWWPTILNKDIIRNVKKIINIHASYLPYGKGKYAYSWSIQNDEKYGASIHYVDESIDGGPILCQREIEIDPTDTGESLCNKGRRESKKLYNENCVNLINSKLIPFTSNEKGSYHSKKDFEIFNSTAKERLFTIEQAIRFLRSRTFKNGKSYSLIEDEKIYDVHISVVERND